MKIFGSRHTHNFVLYLDPANWDLKFCDVCYAQENLKPTDYSACSPTCASEPYCIYPRCALRQEAK